MTTDRTDARAIVADEPTPNAGIVVEPAALTARLRNILSRPALSWFTPEELAGCDCVRCTALRTRTRTCSCCGYTGSFLVNRCTCAADRADALASIATWRTDPSDRRGGGLNAISVQKLDEMEAQWQNAPMFCVATLRTWEQRNARGNFNCGHGQLRCPVCDGGEVVNATDRDTLLGILRDVNAVLREVGG